MIKYSAFLLGSHCFETNKLKMKYLLLLIYATKQQKGFAILYYNLIYK